MSAAGILDGKAYIQKGGFENIKNNVANKKGRREFFPGQPFLLSTVYQPMPLNRP
jgi:hypothetical protein